MTTARCAWMVLLLVVLAGCGDDASDDRDDAGPMTADTGPMSTDTGPMNVDAGPPQDDAGADAGAEPIALTFAIVDVDGAPIAGVHVALDAESGRLEAQSDAAGHVTIEVPAREGDTVDATFADEEHVVASFVDLPVERAADAMNVTLFEHGSVGGTDVRVPMHIEVTGLPAGGRGCFAVDAWALCAPADRASLDVMVPEASVPMGASVWIMDAADTVVDYAEATIADGVLRVTVDGVLEVEPTLEREVTIDLAGDQPDNPLATAALPLAWGWYFSATHHARGRMLGIFTSVVRDGATLRGRYTGFHGTETSPTWQVVALADPRGMPIRSIRRLDTDPGSHVTALPLASLESGGGLGDELTFSRPIADHDYMLLLLSNAGAPAWIVVAPGTRVSLPALPSGYDPGVAFPFAGSRGSLVIRSQERVAEPSGGLPSQTFSRAYPFQF